MIFESELIVLRALFQNESVVVSNRGITPASEPVNGSSTMNDWRDFLVRPTSKGLAWKIV
jgi:hypothetical protein